MRNRELGEFGFLAAHKSLITMSQLAEKDRDRPYIRNNVMHHQHQDVLVSTELHQNSSEQRPTGQVEWLLTLLAGIPYRFLSTLVLRQMRKDQDRYLHIVYG